MSRKKGGNKGAAAGAAPAGQPQQQQQNAPQQQQQQQNNHHHHHNHHKPDGAANPNGGSKRNDDFCVFVGNVAFNTTWQKLKDVMRKAGDVHLVELVVDSSHKPKGSALVTFGNEADANGAVSMLNGTMVDGREILVRKYEKGARPLVIYGNYTREQLNRVVPKDKQGNPAPQQAGSNQQHGEFPGGDRVSLRPQGGHGHQQHHQQQQHQQQQQQQGGKHEFRVFDGGDFNKRNKDTFGDEAASYKPHGNGVPTSNYGGHHQQHSSVPLPASAAAAAGMDRKKLFVSNLPFTCTWKLLKDTFAQVGKVLRADIIMDDRGRSRGMGTVIFATTEDAVKAIEEFDGIEMEGRAMGVRLDRDFLGPHN